jgi:hypothetical protein
MFVLGSLGGVLAAEVYGITEGTANDCRSNAYVPAECSTPGIDYSDTASLQAMYDRYEDAGIASIAVAAIGLTTILLTNHRAGNRPTRPQDPSRVPLPDSTYTNVIYIAEWQAHHSLPDGQPQTDDPAA